MIFLIGGTSETAPIASGLAEAGYAVFVSMATATPLSIGDHPRISRRAGSLDEEGMVALGEETGIRAIVDAAHPYAEIAHITAHNAAKRLGVPCLVFRRPEALTSESDHHHEASAKSSHDDTGHAEATGNSLRFAADHAEAAEMAFASGRLVFLMTGSRNLAPYTEAAHRTGVPFAVRVLDTPESLAACRAACIPEKRIIVGRGPFSVNENLAVIHRFGIGVIVTKESGRAGGIEAKLDAAAQADCTLIVLRRPAMPACDAVFDNPLLLISRLASLVPATFQDQPCPI
jgi:precorrin-6A/cobalt-precorrin-6A reductase